MSSRAGYVVAGIAVVALSFMTTWFAATRLLDAASSSMPIVADRNAPAPEDTQAAPAGPAVTAETAMAELPNPAQSAFGWIGIQGLHVQVVEGASPIAGQPILRLVAIPTDGPHTLAAQLTALERRMYRLAAWIRPAGASFGIAASDQARTGASAAVGIFDLANLRTLSASSRAGIERGPAGWRKVWIELPTSNRQLVVSLYVCLNAASTFKGDGILAVDFGGIVAEPTTALTAGKLGAGIAVSVLLFWAIWLLADRWFGGSTPSQSVVGRTSLLALERTSAAEASSPQSRV